MKIIERKTKTELKNDEIKKIMHGKVYFCPHCLTIFSRNTDYKYNKMNDNYSCCECFSKPFTHDDYKKLKRDSRYILCGSIDIGTIDRYISNIIIEFKNNGFSNREIHKITHFSLAKINELVSGIEICSEQTISLQEFLTKHLELNEDDSNNIINGKKAAAPLKTFTEKAKIYGCTYDFIADVLHIRRACCSTGIKLQPSSYKSMQINKSNRKIILDNDIVKIISKEYSKK